MRAVLINRIILALLFSSGIVLILPVVNASENSCVDCHKTLTPFIEEQRRFNEIRIQHLERNVTCSLECHADRIMQLATANYQQWSTSLHALNGVTCDKCHGGDPSQATQEKAHANLKNVTDPQSPVYYTNVPNTCGQCHSQELENFENSTHYKRLEALQTAPTCTTCHHPHVFGVLNPEDFRNSCGTCHSIYTKVAPYDVPLRAEDLLRKVNKLKFNIENTKQDIYWAKQNGTDTTQAEAYWNNAYATLGTLPPMWHEFNLTHFEDEINLANDQVNKAEKLVQTTPAPTKTAAPSVPGFAGATVLISLVAVFYILRKKY